MAALDQHGPRPHAQQRLSGGEHAGLVGDGQAGQRLRLRSVGGQQIAKRQQILLQRLHGVFLQKAAAALADAHGVYYQREIPFTQSPGHGPDNGGGKKHAGLGGGNGKALAHGLQLQQNKFRFRRMDAQHPFAVLRRQGGDDAHTVAAERHNGFQVGLNARAAAGIGTGDSQNIRWQLHNGFLCLCTQRGGRAARAPSPLPYGLKCEAFQTQNVQILGL